MALASAARILPEGKTYRRKTGMTALSPPEAASAPASVGALLRRWRERRRMSQLDLALEAEISARHLSFVETGRGHPSREMVLLLAEALAVPPRARNDLLAAAGYPPVYPESGLDAPELAQFRRALDFMLRQQEPYPAIVLDRQWNIVRANDGMGRLMDRLLDPAAAAALGPPNALRLICHPTALRPSIVNWEATAAALIQSLHRDLLQGPDPGLQQLLEELLSYPDVPRNWRTLDLDASRAPFLAIEMQAGEARLSFFTTMTTLGTPYDITLHELRIESFFPADQATEAVLRRFVSPLGDVK
jgi:transcriptional regulator with XRE-family HTH domain